METKSEALSVLATVEGMAEVLGRADHVDVKSVVGRVSLRRFLAGFLGHRPGWLAGLYRARGLLAKAFGLAHDTGTVPDRIDPADIPMRPGERLRFFTVTAADEDRYWIAEAADRHLQAWICVLATPLPREGSRFDVATVVRYRHWTGPVYFNLIRPFHHLVVACMARAGATG